jgi:hypothetical protein
VIAARSEVNLRVVSRLRVLVTAAHQIEDADRRHQPADDPVEIAAQVRLGHQARGHHRQAQQDGQAHMAQARQQGDAQGAARRPLLGAPDQHERQPVRGQGRMQEGHGETGGGDGGEEGRVHAPTFRLLYCNTPALI